MRPVGHRRGVDLPPEVSRFPWCSAEPGFCGWCRSGCRARGSAGQELVLVSVSRDVGDHVRVVGQQLGEGLGVASELVGLLRVPEVQGLRDTRVGIAAGVGVVLGGVAVAVLHARALSGGLVGNDRVHAAHGWWPKITISFPWFSALFSSFLSHRNWGWSRFPFEEPRCGPTADDAALRVGVDGDEADARRLRRIPRVVGGRAVRGLVLCGSTKLKPWSLSTSLAPMIALICCFETKRRSGSGGTSIPAAVGEEQHVRIESVGAGKAARDDGRPQRLEAAGGDVLERLVRVLVPLHEDVVVAVRPSRRGRSARRG